MQPSFWKEIFGCGRIDDDWDKKPPVTTRLLDEVDEDAFESSSTRTVKKQVIVDVRHLEKRFGGRKNGYNAVDKLNLVMYKNEITALLGEGC